MGLLRKRFLVGIVSLCCTAVLWYGVTSCGGPGSGEAGVPLYLQSDDIPGVTIADTYVCAACGGTDFSPQLFWNIVPGNALSLAITVLDIDANDFVHWILYNIPATILELDRGTAPPTGAAEATNGYGEVGYDGPCPPSGVVHSYEFKLWVLNIADLTTADGFDPNDNDSILQALQDHDINSDNFYGAYRAP